MAASHSQNLWKTHSYTYKYLTLNRLYRVHTLCESAYSDLFFYQLYVPVSILAIDSVDKGSQLIRVYLLKYTSHTNPPYTCISFTIHFPYFCKISMNLKLEQITRLKFLINTKYKSVSTSSPKFTISMLTFSFFSFFAILTIWKCTNHLKCKSFFDEQISHLACKF